MVVVVPQAIALTFNIIEINPSLTWQTQGLKDEGRQGQWQKCVTPRLECSIPKLLCPRLQLVHHHVTQGNLLQQLQQLRLLVGQLDLGTDNTVV